MNKYRKADFTQTSQQFFCDNCDERMAFVMQFEKNGEQFILPLSSVLECLFCAEQAGEVPPLDADWWIELSLLYPTVRDLYDRRPSYENIQTNSSRSSST